MKKKILSLMLAMVMMLSLSVTALAANTVQSDTANGSYTDSTGTYGDASSVSFTKSFVLTNKGDSPAETFSFTINEYDRSSLGAEYKYDPDNDPVPTLSTASFTKGDATADGTGTGLETVTITLPEASAFPSVGVYSYKITENVPDTVDAGVSYNTESNQYLLVVSIVNGTKSVYNEETSAYENVDTLVRIVALHVLNEDGSVGDKVDGSSTSYTDGADFTNTYTANSLSVTKTVEGTYGDKTKEFEFTVTFACNTEGVNFDGEVISIAEGSGAIPVGEGWNTNHTEYTFTLSDGDTVTFENVPKGVAYTVKENDYSDEGYETTGEVETAKEMADEDVEVTVTNTKGGTVDTGISLDSLPYILMLIVVAAGVVVIISRRRLDNRF